MLMQKVGPVVDLSRKRRPKMKEPAGGEDPWKEVVPPRTNSSRNEDVGDPGETEILRLRRRIDYLERIERAHEETREMLESSSEMNRKLEETLKKARKEIQSLRDELIRLTTPPVELCRCPFRQHPSPRGPDPSGNPPRTLRGHCCGRPQDAGDRRSRD